MYHGFCAPGTTLWRDNPEGNHVDIGEFERQIQYLSRHHSIVPLERVQEALAGGRPLPLYAVVLSMDDGYRSNYTLAYPVLARYKAAASVFVTTEFIDRRIPLWPDRLAVAIARADPSGEPLEIDGIALDMRDEIARRRTFATWIARLKDVPQEDRDRILSRIERTLDVRTDEQTNKDPQLPPTFEPLAWDEVRALARSGWVTIGNHTHTHRILARCTPETQRHEIESAHRLLEQHLGQAPRLFCYPNGRRSDYDATTIATLRALGYSCALTTELGFNTTASDVFELKRVAVNHAATIEDFATILYGGWKGLVRDLARVLTLRPLA